MRCKACDVELSNYESTLRCSNTNEFIDLCTVCLAESDDVNYTDRADLRSLADVTETEGER
jgi:hypothetical protein